MGKIITPPYYLQWSYLQEGYPPLNDYNYMIWETRKRFHGQTPHGKPTAENIRTVILRYTGPGRLGQGLPKRAKIVSQRKKDKGAVIAEYTFAMFEAIPKE